MKEYDSICLADCLVCGCELGNYASRDDQVGNHPCGGLEFKTRGHYGSTLFDPMDASMLIINICDPCLATARDRGRVLTTLVVGRAEPKEPVERWTKR